MTGTKYKIMQENAQTNKNVGVVQILNLPLLLEQKQPLLETLVANAAFLAKHHVEYVVLDCEQDSSLLDRLAHNSDFQKRLLKYYKLRGGPLKNIFRNACNLTTAEHLFFIFNRLQLTEANILAVEKTAPLLSKKDLPFFEQVVPENFHPKDFNLYMKPQKNLWEKIKLLFI